MYNNGNKQGKNTTGLNIFMDYVLFFLFFNLFQEFEPSCPISSTIGEDWQKISHST